MLRKKLPNECEAILASGIRWQIVNLWRPIQTIYKDPLAVGASHSFAEEDLIQAEVVYTQQKRHLGKNQTWTIVPNEKHQWYYKNEQRPDEVVFIKCFDSDEREGLARRAPHCAFVDQDRSGEQYEDRESIEVRALLFNE